MGLLYLAGMLKGNRQNLDDLWATDGTGVDIFRATMCQTRFRILLQSIRFDCISNREERRKLDKLAAIRAIFDRFVENCISCYSPSEYVTIDEKLEAFRGRCSFRQFIPNKPAKYGIKIFALVDARTFFVLNQEVYVGKQPPGPFEVSNTPEEIVLRLCQPIKNSRRNVTFDNWFASYSLVVRLLKEYQLTSVCTLRKNKREIPNAFLEVKQREVKSSLFGFQKDVTLVSYVPKKGKNVLLFSTMHHDNNIDEETGADRKPEIITFYNVTKGGVEVADELSSNYNVSRNSRRWPLTIFFSLLNTASINAFVIYKNNNTELPRRKFIKQLGLALLSDYMQERQANPRLPRSLKRKISDITKTSDSGTPSGTASNNSGKRQAKSARCVYCERSKDRKTFYNCLTCNRFVCLEHAVVTCDTCNTENKSE